MEKKIQDYLHLYLGCNVIMTRDEYTLPHPVVMDVDLLKEALNCEIMIKPILRPLNSRTEEDRDWLEWHQGHTYQHEAIRVHYLLSKQYDQFGLIDDGLAIDATKINIEQ